MTFLICSVMIWRFPFISLQVLHLVLLLDFLFYSFEYGLLARGRGEELDRLLRRTGDRGLELLSEGYLDLLEEEGDLLLERRLRRGLSGFYLRDRRCLRSEERDLRLEEWSSLRFMSVG